MSGTNGIMTNPRGIKILYGNGKVWLLHIVYLGNCKYYSSRTKGSTRTYSLEVLRENQIFQTPQMVGKYCLFAVID